MSIPLDRLQAGRIGPPPLPAKTQPLPKTLEPGKLSFADHLRQACDKGNHQIKFSGHAQARIDSRHISFDRDQLARLSNAIESAAQKGAEKALVIVDETALIVGVDKKTVITVVDKEGLKENVFTQIDAAVIA